MGEVRSLLFLLNFDLFSFSIFVTREKNTKVVKLINFMKLIINSSIIIPMSFTLVSQKNKHEKPQTCLLDSVIPTFFSLYVILICTTDQPPSM